MELTYKNIIGNFFVGDHLIASRRERNEQGFKFVLANVPKSNLSTKLQDVIKKKVSSVEVTFSIKWRESRARSKEEFEQKFERWIHTDLKLPASITSEQNRQRGSTQELKKFKDLSERQRKRRAEDLNGYEIGQLLLAASKAARETGQSDLVYVLHLLYKNSNAATDIRRFMESKK